MKKFDILIILYQFRSFPEVIYLLKIADKKIEKYSENQNYFTLSGKVTEFDENNVIIKCEELNEYISYQNELCDDYIYSNQMIELSVGDKIEFVTILFHFL